MPSASPAFIALYFILLQKPHIAPILGESTPRGGRVIVAADCAAAGVAAAAALFFTALELSLIHI